MSSIFPGANAFADKDKQAAENDHSPANNGENVWHFAKINKAVEEGEDQQQIVQRLDCTGLGKHEGKD